VLVEMRELIVHLVTEGVLKDLELLVIILFWLVSQAPSQPLVVDTAQSLILRVGVLAVLEAVQVLLMPLCIAEEPQQQAQRKEIMAVVMETQVVHTHLAVAAVLGQ
jgi:hypothetical protein